MEGDLQDPPFERCLEQIRDDPAFRDIVADPQYEQYWWDLWNSIKPFAVE